MPLTGLPRVATVKPVRDLAAAAACLRATLPGKLQGAAVAASSARLAWLRPELQRLGANYFCAPGELENPPLSWRQDGIRPLRGMLVAGG